MVKALLSYLRLEKQSWKNLILSLLTTTVNVCAVQKALCFIQIVVFNTRLALLLYSYIQSIGINFYCRYLF